MTPQAMYEQLHARLHRVVPDAELRQKAAIAVEILDEKRRRNAVVLGHNYMEPALFAIGAAQQRSHRDDQGRRQG